MCHRLKMGVPDDMDGPPRKKFKLSLHSKQKEESERASSHSGNTCFMNCILQILRYTPNFLTGLAVLKEKIDSLEAKLEQKDDDKESPLSPDTRRNWRVVKDIYWMYHRMDEKEVQYNKNPMSQTSHMAVRPSTVLNGIRDINPMFEGNFQHDAQELLHCLLCYMEDAEKDVQKMDTTLSKVETEFSKSANPDVEKEMVENTGEKLIPSAQFGTPDLVVGSAVEGDEDLESEGNAALNRRQRPKKRFKLKGGAPPSRTNKRKMLGSKELCTAVTAEDDHGRGKGAIDHCSIGAKVKRGVKRKRSKQDNEVDFTNGGDNKNAVGEIEKKPKSAPLTSTLKNGLAATKNKIQRNGQSIVGFLTRVKDKLVPNAVTSEHAEWNGKEETNAATGPSFNMSASPIRIDKPCKPKKRMGMTGYVITQDKTEKKVENNSDCYIIEDERKELPFVNGRCGSRGGQVGDVTESSTLKDFSSPPQSLNEDRPPSGESFAARSPVCGTPSKSAKSFYQVNDEITLASENDLSFDMESTIDSVTKKYYSSLPREDLHSAQPVVPSPGRPASPEMSSENVASIAKTKQKLMDSPCGRWPSTEFCLISPGADLVIHSPSKVDISKSENSSGRRQSKAAKTLDFKPTEETTPSPSLNEQSFERDVKLLDFLPKQARQISESHSVKALKNNLLTLDVNGITTRSSRSAPTTPDGNDMNNSAQPVKLVTENQSESGRNKFGCPSQLGEQNLAPLKIKLKRCDWLGVSPVKSVSASSALRTLRLQERKPLLSTETSVSGTKRNILHDLNNLDSGSPKSLSQNPSQVLNPAAESNLVQQNTNNSREISSLDEEQLSTPLCDKGSFISLCRGQRDISSTLKPNQSSSEINAISKKSTPSERKGLANKDPVAVDPKHGPGEATHGSNILRGPTQAGAYKSINCPSGLKLKKLSVSVDKCDWMLSPSAACSVTDNRRRMINGRVKGLRSRERGLSGDKLYNSPCKPEIQKGAQLVTETGDDKKQKHPLIERLFGGTMVHLTRCLECETGRERKENFLDISIAVRHLNEGDADDSLTKEETSSLDSACPSSLASLISSSSSVERLRASNKYWCEECLHHVEAERSCHYLDLPQILSLHLKRFSSNSGLFGGLSKLNDKVDIPEELPCLRHRCANPCRDPTHSYQLFALATHSGLSILHGHYRAYVKVQPWVNPQVFHNLTSYQNGSSSGSSNDIADTGWSPAQTCSSTHPVSVGSSSPFSSYNSEHEQTTHRPTLIDNVFNSVQHEDTGIHKDTKCPSLSSSSHSSQSVPRSYERLVKEENPSASRCITDFFSSNVPRTKNNGVGSSSGSCFAPPLQRPASGCSDAVISSVNNDTGTLNVQSSETKENLNQPNISECCHDGSISSTIKEELADSKPLSCYWLECDDECLRVMEQEEFGQKLREEDSALLGTPYLLFYHSQGLPPS
ncbi:ubiquitin carboxyl-terminal hydrolase [Elysia marginata]|uniref:Ubiquitin carboxyl-terminal hydrolase n=1 Tax=Elysia marginata TaxID=1093978 RepID=A0AAV4EQK3_9GAST|nr:ubiquitin carboxyl-terminal hydrolase [Elysia marginata]